MSPAPPPLWKRYAPDLLALGLVAALRIWAAHAFAPTALADHPMVDAYTYWEQAEALCRGQDPFAQEGYYQPPAYPYLLSLLCRAGLPGLDTARQLQLFLGLLTAAGIAAIGRRIGQPRGLPWLGAAAALLWGLCPTPLLFELDILTPALSAALLVAGGLSFGPGLPRSLLAGLCWGGAVAVHPTVALLPLLALGALALARAWGPALALSAGLCLPILPTALRNQDQFGVLQPVSHNAGINLYLGNNPDWQGTVFLRPGLPFRQLAVRAEPDRRNVAERDAYWRQQALNHWVNSPGQALLSLVQKAAWSVSRFEIPRNEDYRCRTRPGDALAPLGWLAWPFSYALLFPLALVGLWGLRRGVFPFTPSAGSTDPSPPYTPSPPSIEPPNIHSASSDPPAPAPSTPPPFEPLREQSAPLALGLAWLALHLPQVLFFPSDRYRALTLPLIALLAAAGIAALWHRRAALATLAPALGLGLLLPWLAWDPRLAADPLRCAYAAGNLATMEEQWEEAERAYREVLAGAPRDMGAHYWLGQLRARAGDRPAALAHLQLVAEQYPDHFPTLKQLGELSEQLQDTDQAIRWYRLAFEVPGDRRPTGRRLLRLLREAGREAEADQLLREHPELRD